MIKDIFFVFRILGITILVVLAMQARVGQDTVETRFHDWLQTSFLVDSIQDIIDGGVAVTKDGYRKADTGFRSLLGRVGRRGEAKRDRLNAFGFTLKRYNDTDDDEELSTPAPKTRTPAISTSAKSSRQITLEK